MPRTHKPGDPEPTYIVKRDGAMWRVYDRRGIVQFSSLKRINCTDLVQSQQPSN